MKTITIITYNRPRYLRAVIQSLRANDFKGYTLFVGMEPGCDEVVEIIESIDWIEKVVVKNRERLHRELNLKNILETAFAHGSIHNVCLEDDVILSPDALELANWFFDLPNNQYLCLNLFNHHSDPSFPSEVLEAKYYNSIGWCITADSWYRMISTNCMSDKRGWDWSIAYLLKSRPSLKTLHPRLARSNHIGRDHGQHRTPEFHDRTFSHIQISDGVFRSYFVKKQLHFEAKPPLVTAIMITGGDPSRVPFAQMAIQCFLDQTYQRKELLIVNHGKESLFIDDSRIRELRLAKSPLETLGDLRNIGLDYARGALSVVWDDDDWHHPMRIEAQVARYRKDAVVILENQIRYSLPNESGFAISVPSGIPGTMLHSCAVPFRFPSLDYGEDSCFVEKFPEVIVVSNPSELYIRFFHGGNLSTAEHIMGDFANNDKRGHIQLSDRHRAILSNVLSKYEKKLAKRMI